MNTTDEQLIQQLRSELDELAAGVRNVAGDPPPWQPNATGNGADHGRRWVAVGIAAATIATVVGGLVVIANRDAGEATSDMSPATPTTVPAVDSVAPTTQPVVPDPAVQRYEVIAPVLETAERGTQLCLGQWMVSATPPLCDGPELDGWSWDFVGGGHPAGTGTWSEAYVAGTWDATTQVFTADEGRAPTAADHDRFAADASSPDNSVPCPEPAGGWPARNQEWPSEQIHAVPGYAGSWEDPTHQVVTVKFVGDLQAAEVAVRQYYTDNLCVVAAQHSEQELVAIQNQLMGMSSVKWLWGMVYADATGEWVELGVITPDPDRQAAFDQQYGDGLVRLTPRLRAI